MNIFLIFSITSFSPSLPCMQRDALIRGVRPVGPTVRDVEEDNLKRQNLENKGKRRNRVWHIIQFLSGLPDRSLHDMTVSFPVHSR